MSYYITTVNGSDFAAPITYLINIPGTSFDRFFPVVAAPPVMTIDSGGGGGILVSPEPPATTGAPEPGTALLLIVPVVAVFWFRRWLKETK